jgi:hypothetical protein
MTIRDIAALAWLGVVLVVVYGGLPAVVRALSPVERRGAWLPLIAGLIATVAIGVEALSLAAFINSITVVVLHLAWTAAMIVHANRTFDRTVEQLLRAAVRVDGSARPTRLATIARTALMKRVSHARCVPRPYFAAFAAMGATVAVVRVLPVLAEARLFHPLAYAQLFTVRNIIAGDAGLASPVLAWVAALSTLASLDAARTIHFLPPLLACAVTAMMVRVPWKHMRNMDAGLVAGFVWLLTGSGLAAPGTGGGALALQHAAPGEMVAVVMLLSLLASRSLASALAPAVVIVLFAPVLAPLAAVALVASRSIKVPTVACGWTIIAAAFAPVTLPAALGLAAAAVYAVARMPVRATEPAVARAFGVTVLMVGVVLVPPAATIEHDAVAREALEVLRASNGEPWTVVGGPVPLLRGHPAGTFRTFASLEGGLDNSRHAFVIVRKRSFNVSDSAFDPAALFAAEKWAHATPGVRIVRDDDVLRVYHRPRSGSRHDR